MSRKISISIALTVGLLAALPTSGFAATTFGTTLGAAISSTPTECITVVPAVPATCTIMNGSVSEGGGISPGGLAAPSDGVITRWRVGLGDFGSIGSMTATPRVFSITQLNKLTALRSGTPRSIPSGGGELTFDDRLKVAVGDRIGLDITTVGAAGAGPYLTTSTGVISAKTLQFTPSLADGSVTTLPILGPATSERFQINADVEADTDFDGFGDETQDLCPTRADVQAVCPPPVVTVVKFSKGVFSFTSDIPGKATTTLSKVIDGRKVGKKCKSKRKSGKKCKIYTKFAEWKDDVVAGANKINYAYKVGGKSLKPGKYQATIVITSAQNTVTSKTVDFTIKKPKKKRK